MTLQLLCDQRTLVRVLVIFALVVGGLAPSSSLAQQESEAQVEFKEGPYEIKATTNQPAPYSADVEFVVFVVEAATREPVDHAQVRIRTRNEVDGTEGWAIALNAPQRPDRYVAKAVALSTTGTWNIFVEVSSPLGEVTVELQPVEVRVTSRSLAGALVLVGASLAFVLGAMYLWWSSRRELRKRETTEP